MDWFKDLYDDFRVKRTFGSISDERTKKDVDFIINVLDLSPGSKVLDLFSGLGRHSIELGEYGVSPPLSTLFYPQYVLYSCLSQSVAQLTIPLCLLLMDACSHIAQSPDSISRLPCPINTPIWP